MSHNLSLSIGPFARGALVWHDDALEQRILTEFAVGAIYQERDEIEAAWQIGKGIMLASERLFPVTRHRSFQPGSNQRPGAQR